MLLKGLTQAILVKRYKRFLADVEMPGGEVVTVHCPNPGSMMGIAEPGMKVLLAKSPNLKRKLPWTMQFVDAETSLVLVESAMANKLFFEAFCSSLFEPLKVYSQARAEHAFRDSRLDFLLSGDHGQCLVEVKSTTYLHQGVALFPDAKTERGRKHLHTLGDGLDHGFCSLQFFVVARSDASLFKPAEAIDQAYAQALRLAQKRGVQIMAYSLKFKKSGGRALDRDQDQDQDQDQVQVQDQDQAQDQHQHQDQVDLEVMIDKALPIDLN